MLNDTLASGLSKILNNARTGKKTCKLTPASKILRKVLDIMNEEGYVGTYEQITPEKGGVIELNLIGKINKCGVIKPRFTVKHDEFKKFEKRYLLAEDFGVIIVSTNQGIMTHQQAKKKMLGGKLIAYCY